MANTENLAKQSVAHHALIPKRRTVVQGKSLKATRSDLMIVPAPGMKRTARGGRTLALVDKEIKNQLMLLSDLRAEKNSFFPVFLLPPEILEHIFTLLAHDHYHKSIGDLHFQGVPSWVSVSYVCRHWRNLALNCPTLWTYHFSASLRWTEEILVRSKEAPLKIYLCRHYVENPRSRSWWFELGEKLLGHVARIQELRVCIESSTDFPLQRFLHTPSLQILEISAACLTRLDLEVNNVDIPPIRKLVLDRCSLAWHSPSLNGLTTLYLKFLPFSSKLDIAELVTRVSHMHGLIVLYLSGALVTVPGSPLSGVLEKVKLPSLARLVVNEAFPLVVALLSCINIPLETELELDFEAGDKLFTRDYSQIPSVLAQMFHQFKRPSPFNPTIHSLILNCREFMFCGDYNLCPVPVEYWRNWSAQYPLKIYVGTHGVAHGGEDIISDTLCSLPLTHLQTLHVVAPPQSPAFWNKTLGHFPGLRHLTLSDGSMPHLSSLLAQAADEPAGTLTGGYTPTPSHKFVPTLEELELDHIRFASDDRLQTQDATSKKLLLDALATRTALRFSESGYDSSY